MNPTQVGWAWVWLVFWWPIVALWWAVRIAYRFARKAGWG